MGSEEYEAIMDRLDQLEHLLLNVLARQRVDSEAVRGVRRTQMLLERSEGMVERAEASEGDEVIYV